jgi:hypothetical protein
LKGGRGQNTAGGSFFKGGSGGSSGGRQDRGESSSSIYTMPGSIGYRPYFHGTGQQEEYNCTDFYDDATNVTTTTCTYVNGRGNKDILLILVIVTTAVLTFAGITIWYRNRGKSKTYTIDTSKIDGIMRNQRVDLTEKVDMARMEVQGSNCKGIHSNSPVDGWYAYSYHQNGKALSGKCIITFVEKGGEGFIISGTSTDPDGLTNIDEDFCNHIGKAYWKEGYVSGDIGLNVLNKGVFNFTTCTFEGELWATSGESGVFDSFRLEEKR